MRVTLTPTNAVTKAVTTTVTKMQDMTKGSV